MTHCVLTYVETLLPMNKRHSDNPKPSALQAFLDGVALEAYDRQVTPMHGPATTNIQRESGIVPGRGVHRSDAFSRTANPLADDR
jgi:hypothetical protein